MPEADGAQGPAGCGDRHLYQLFHSHHRLFVRSVHLQRPLHAAGGSEPDHHPDSAQPSGRHRPPPAPGAGTNPAPGADADAAGPAPDADAVFPVSPPAGPPVEPARRGRRRQHRPERRAGTGPHQQAQQQSRGCLPGEIRGPATAGGTALLAGTGAVPVRRPQMEDSAGGFGIPAQSGRPAAQSRRRLHPDPGTAQPALAVRPGTARPDPGQHLPERGHATAADPAGDPCQPLPHAGLSRLPTGSPQHHQQPLLPAGAGQRGPQDPPPGRRAAPAACRRRRLRQCRAEFLPRGELHLHPPAPGTGGRCHRRFSVRFTPRLLHSLCLGPGRDAAPGRHSGSHRQRLPGG